MLIATRVLTLCSDSGEVDVPVQLFAPEQDQQMKCWKVRYTIGWPDEPFESAGFGEDAVQALILTLQMIGAVLYTSEAHASGSLSWHEAGTGYGFLMPRTTRDLLVEQDRDFY